MGSEQWSTKPSSAWGGAGRYLGASLLPGTRLGLTVNSQVPLPAPHLRSLFWLETRRSPIFKFVLCVVLRGINRGCQDKVGAGELRVTEGDISNRSNGQGVGQAPREKSCLAPGMVSAKALGQVQARLPFLQDLKGPSVICTAGRETEAQGHTGTCTRSQRPT